jgi:AcrR family transcriptional regulator
MGHSTRSKVTVGIMKRDESHGGRSTQKRLTRRRLLAATRTLMLGHETVTVAAAAKKAGVATATAYRYFASAETLRLEAGLEVDMGSTGDFMDLMLERCANVSDVAERVAIAHRVMVDFVRRNEDSYRLFIAKGHEQLVNDSAATKRSPRGGRRIALIEYAVAPARERLGPDGVIRLVRALASAIGPEPYFVLRDVMRLTEEEIDLTCESVLADIVAAHLGRGGDT